MNAVMGLNSTEGDWNVTQLYEEGVIAIQPYSFLMILHSVIVLSGVPLNLFVALVLVSDRKLYNARNAIWLGVIVSNLMVFFMTSLEYFIFYRHSYLACHIQCVMAGKAYLTLLINLLLATCDRLIYTKWPEFHARHVTVPRVIATQLICSIGAVAALTAHFWALDMPVKCGLQPANVRLTMAAIVTCSILCIVLKTAVYVMAQESVASEQNGVVTREIPLEDIATCQPAQQELQIENPDSGQITNESRNVNRPRLFAHCTRERIRQMELNATMTLVAGLGPLGLFTLLSYLYMLRQMLCPIIFKDCETFGALEVYFKESMLLHVSTDLLLYIFRSLEFRAAAKNLIKYPFKKLFRH